MVFELPVSIGEAVDKLSILDIKLQKIQDHRRIDVEKEYQLLYDRLKDTISTYSTYYRILVDINTNIWNMQDELRKDITRERHHELCIATINENDRRFRVKNKINNSSIREQKGYNTKRAFILHHLGLCDMFTMSGAVRYLATIYDEVTVVCKRSNEKNIRALYADDPSIKLYLVDTDRDISPTFGANHNVIKEIYENYTVYSCGIHIRSDTSDMPYSFYKDMGMNPDIMRTYWYINIHNELYDLVKDIPYIFVHEDSSSKRREVNVDTDMLIINPIRNPYTPDHKYYEIAQKMLGHLVVDFVHIIENAKELHLIDSSFLSLANLIDTSKVSKKICYSRNGARYRCLDGYEYA